MYQEYFSYLNSFSYLNNTLLDYLIFLGIFVLTLILLRIFQSLILSRFRKLALKTKNELDDLLVKIASEVKPPFYLLIALYFSLQYLNISNMIGTLTKLFFVFAIVYESIQAIDKFVIYIAKKHIIKPLKKEDKKERQQAKAMVYMLDTMVKLVLWMIGLTVILANLGVNITSLVASLGIGGIAVALAVQSILSDIFSSISIFLDKPFQVGDFIVISNEHKGTVLRIGLKSTHIKTLRGDELIISNRELTSSKVHNYFLMEIRRADFIIGVTYDTPKTKLERIPGIIKKIISNYKELDFNRCHLKELANSSINYEVVYNVLSSDYDLHVKRQQQVNLDIITAFRDQGIEFAFPTQTLYLEQIQPKKG